MKWPWTKLKNVNWIGVGAIFWGVVFLSGFVFVKYAEGKYSDKFIVGICWLIVVSFYASYWIWEKLKK